MKFVAVYSPAECRSSAGYIGKKAESGIRLYKMIQPALHTVDGDQPDLAYIQSYQSCKIADRCGSFYVDGLSPGLSWEQLTK
jgi:hypothetical protein